MKIVDAHIHLIDLSLKLHPGFETPSTSFIGNNAPICRSFLLEDLLAQSEERAKEAQGERPETFEPEEVYEIVKAVHVEAIATDKIAEARYVQQVADHASFPLAIVAGADLSDMNIEQELATQFELKNLRGIRQILNRHPDPAYNYGHHDYMADPVWQDHFKLLRRFDLSFDMQLYPHQFIQAFALVGNNPDIQFIINHAGMCADRHLAGWRMWRDGIRQFASFANVSIKISGLGMLDHHWTLESIRPYLFEIIDVFGVHRVMFASNFPVDRLYSRYSDIWRAFSTIIHDFSIQEKNLLFAANAERIYRI